MNTLEMEIIIKKMQDDDELAVGYQRTYQSVRDWLIRPVDKRGCGFDAVFVDRMFPIVCDRIKRNELKFGKNNGRAFDQYMKDLCLNFERDVLNESVKVREQLFQAEFSKQQEDGLKLLKDLTDQNNSLRRAVTWLLIVTGLSVLALTGGLQVVTNFLQH
jgi:hypothetical protein